MLVVKLEIWPGGDILRAKEIGCAKIGNISDLSEISDYEYYIFDDKSTKPIHGGVVRFHPRKDGAWALLARVILSFIGKEVADGSRQA